MVLSGADLCYTSDFLKRLISCDLGNSPFPSVNDRVSVDSLDCGEEPLAQLLRGGDADVAEHGAGEFGEVSFDEIEPRACLGVNTKLKRPSGCSSSQALVSLDLWAE